MKTKTKISVIAGVAISTMSTVTVAQTAPTELVNMGDEIIVNKLSIELTKEQNEQLNVLTSLEGKASKLEDGMILASCGTDNVCPTTGRHKDNLPGLWERFLNLFKTKSPDGSMVALTQKITDKEFS